MIMGHCFRDGDFLLFENMKKGQTFSNKNCNFISDNNLELIGGKGEKSQFDVEEFEFYKVI